MQAPGTSPAPASLADREVLDDHALRRARLLGSLARGLGWRRRKDRSPVARLLLGAVLASVAVGVLMATSFVRSELAEQRVERTRQQSTVATSQATGTSG